MRQLLKHDYELIVEGFESQNTRVLNKFRPTPCEDLTEKINRRNSR